MCFYDFVLHFFIIKIFKSIVSYYSKNENYQRDKLSIDGDKMWIVINGQRFEWLYKYKKCLAEFYIAARHFLFYITSLNFTDSACLCLIKNKPKNITHDIIRLLNDIFLFMLLLNINVNAKNSHVEIP